jgi:hypothetical protein
MRKDEVENLKVKDLKHVLLPLKRGRMLKNYVDIGFDTEYTSEDNSAERELISLQFSLGKGKSRVYYVNKQEGISSEELLNYAVRFLNEEGVEPKRHIFLIAHYAIAELSKINDFYDEYTAEKGYKTRPKVSQFNKAVRWERRFGDLTLHINDLYGHMKASLEKIGAGLGYEKVRIEVGGKDHQHWITHMKELKEKHRDTYKAYAVRDAEIAIEAWKALKQKYEPLNLDPHLYTTYTSLAVASFRRQMTKLPCKTTKEPILTRQKMKQGWREHIAKKTVFNGNLNVRLLAALSYWGGNNQAFARGHFKDIDATYYDFISLYIIAGIIQPLSYEDTEYRRLKLKDVTDAYEGFCQVEFEFPNEQNYPCLPVQENYYPKLMFPLKGTSYCTLAELRQALELGVKAKSFKGYGFYPEENEIEHDLKPFLAGMLKRKSELEASGKRGNTDYNIEKAKMVGIIGRFAYRRPSHTAEDITRLLHESGLRSEEFRRYGKKKAIRALYTKSEVGGSWHVEWASLIVGRARAMTASVIPQGEKCFLISTDGGMWLGDPKFNQTKLHKEISKFHSGIRLEGKLDELWVARNRLYVAWNKGEVLHLAMMGIAVPGRGEEKKVNFQKMITESLEAGKEIYNEAETWRLTGLNDYIHDGVPLNSVQRKTRKISWRPDGKRKLEKDINAFKEHAYTRPYETVEEAYRQWQGIKPVGRPEVLTKEQISEIRATDKKVTHKRLALKYNVSVSTIKRVR